MNLKSFHLVFITCAIALALVLGAWAWSSPTVAGGARTALLVGSFGAGAALVVYGAWFLRALRGQR